MREDGFRDFLRKLGKDGEHRGKIEKVGERRGKMGKDEENWGKLGKVGERRGR